MTYGFEQILEGGGLKTYHLKCNGILEIKLARTSISQYYKAKDGGISSGGTSMIVFNDIVFRITRQGTDCRDLGQ